MRKIALILSIVTLIFATGCDNKYTCEDGKTLVGKECLSCPDGYELNIEDKSCYLIEKEEDYESSLNEIKEYCSNSYQELNYNAISRNPSNYNLSCIHFKGMVSQVIEEKKYAQLRVYTKLTDYSYIENYYNDDAVMVFIYNYDMNNRILEDDIIDIYAVFNDLYTYEAVLGNSITIPSFILLDYNLQ